MTAQRIMNLNGVLAESYEICILGAWVHTKFGKNNDHNSRKLNIIMNG